jgi:hypothetical protein
MSEDRTVAVVRELVFVMLATWGLVGSVLYVWHSEVLQRSVLEQQRIIEQQGNRLVAISAFAKASSDSLQAYKQFVLQQEKSDAD